jgi:hypothetical protein
MSKASFPTAIDATYMGKERESGSFEDNEGVKVSYGEKFLFAFENSQGLIQSVSITDKRLHEAGVDVAKLVKLTQVRIVGDVVVADKGGYLVPTDIKPAPRA